MFLGVEITDLLTLVGAAVLGFVGHVFAKVGEMREHGSRLTFRSYLASAPYKTAAKGIAVLGAVIGLASPGVTLTPLLFVGAMSLGWTADSAGNHLQRYSK